jgi:hypothetical protein
MVLNSIARYIPRMMFGVPSYDSSDDDLQGAIDGAQRVVTDVELLEIIPIATSLVFESPMI